MSDFWTKALGGGAPAPGPRAEPVGQRPWWDTTPAPQQQAQVALQEPQYYPQQPQEQVQAPRQAQSARSTATCPDCGSGDYFQPHGQPNAMAQCYTCGYNPRFAHSTAGAGMPSDKSAPVQPARQVSTKNNYNPTVIIGKIE